MGAMYSYLAFCPPSPPQYDVKTGAFYKRVPYAAGQKFMALKVFAPVGSATQLAHGSTTVALVAHGNGDDLGTAALWLQEVSDRLGIIVVGWDYPGYGQSTGETSEAGVYETALLAYQHCKGDLRATDVLLIGKSLGTGAVMYLAQHEDVLADKLVRGTVLLSPLASGVRTLSASRFMPRHLVEALDEKFMPVLKYAQRMQAPVTIVHGLDDKIIPVSNAYTLQRSVPTAFRTPMLELAFCGHNDMEAKEGTRLWGHVRAFQAEVLVEAGDTE